MSAAVLNLSCGTMTIGVRTIAPRPAPPVLKVHFRFSDSGAHPPIGFQLENLTAPASYFQGLFAPSFAAAKVSFTQGDLDAISDAVAQVNKK